MHGQKPYNTALLCMISAVLMIFVFSFSLFAASPILSAELRPSPDGKTVTVVFTVENNPGIAAYRFTIHFDNKTLKPLSAAINSKISGGMFVSNLEEASDALNMVWVSGANYTGNGELCNAVFSLIGTVKDGQYPIKITYDPADIVNQDSKTGTFEVKGMSESALTVSIQSEQSGPTASSSAGSQAHSLSSQPVISAILSLPKSSAASAGISVPSFAVNSQIHMPDYTGSEPYSTVSQSSAQTASDSQPDPGEKVSGLLSARSQTSDFTSVQSSENEIPVQSSTHPGPDFLVITVSVIAAAAVTVLTVLWIGNKREK